METPNGVKGASKACFIGSAYGVSPHTPTGALLPVPSQGNNSLDLGLLRAVIAQETVDRYADDAGHGDGEGDAFAVF